jgi:hemerythrin superfamily protein
MLNRIHMQKLLEMDYNDKLFVSSVDHMMPYLRQHYETEEKELFPRARQYFDEHQLKALFKILEAAKQVAPSTPRDNHSWLRGKLLQAYDELKKSLIKKKSMA